MSNKLVKNVKVAVSQSDSSGFMSVPGVFTLFMDMASEHGNLLDMGMDALAKKGLIWLVSKTKLKIHAKPAMFSDITASTWPGEAARIRSNRYYKMEQDGNLIMEAKNEWAIFRPATGKLEKMSEIYPDDLQICPDVVCEDAFLKLKDDYDDCIENYSYTVLSTDLDTSCHMNNVNYIRVVFGVFTSRQLAQMDISDVDIAYKNQCYEGEQLTLKKKNVEDGYEIGVFKADGTAGALVKITLR